MTSSIPQGAAAAVLLPSVPVPETAVSVQGPNFDQPLDLDQFLASYERIGFQANSLGKAINIVNKMVRTSSRRERIPVTFITIVGMASLR